MSGITIAQNVTLNTSAQGGAGYFGGDGHGGYAEYGVAQILVGANSAAIFSGDIVFNAQGFGGDSTLNGGGGFGQGGEVYLTVSASSTLDGGDDGNGGRVRTGGLTINSRGIGGAGGSSLGAGNGGDGTGGYVDLAIAGSAVIGDVNVFNIGIGGNGGNAVNGAGGAGGFGDGGDTNLNVSGDLDALSFFARSNGFGGNGGTGATIDGNGGGASAGDGYAYINGNADIAGNFVCRVSPGPATPGRNGGSRPSMVKRPRRSPSTGR